MEIIDLGRQLGVLRALVSYGQTVNEMEHTGEGLQGSRSLLLQFFAEIIGEKEVMDIPLVA